MDDAAIAIAQVSMIEAHGTGTALGDPTEVSALARACWNMIEQAPVAAASHKANTGHAESPSGVMGLLSAATRLMQQAAYAR